MHPVKWPLKSDILVNHEVKRKSHLTSFAGTIPICHQPAMSTLTSSHLQVLHCTVTIKVVNLITCRNQRWTKPPNNLLQLNWNKFVISILHWTQLNLSGVSWSVSWGSFSSMEWRKDYQLIPRNRAVLEKMTLDSNQPSMVGCWIRVVFESGFVSSMVQWLSTSSWGRAQAITWRSSWSLNTNHRETSLVVDFQCWKKKQKR